MPRISEPTPVIVITEEGAPRLVTSDSIIATHFYLKLIKRGLAATKASKFGFSLKFHEVFAHLAKNPVSARHFVRMVAEHTGLVSLAADRHVIGSNEITVAVSTTVNLGREARCATGTISNRLGIDVVLGYIPKEAFRTKRRYKKIPGLIPVLGLHTQTENQASENQETFLVSDTTYTLPVLQVDGSEQGVYTEAGTSQKNGHCLFDPQG